MLALAMFVIGKVGRVSLLALHNQEWEATMAYIAQSELRVRPARSLLDRALIAQDLMRARMRG